MQVIHEETKEILYTVRIQGKRFIAPVYAAGLYTVKSGPDKPDAQVMGAVQAIPAE